MKSRTQTLASSGEMLANEQFSPMPYLTLKTMLILDHEQYNMVHEGNFEGKFATKLLDYIVFYAASAIFRSYNGGNYNKFNVHMYSAVFYILNMIVKEIYIKHLMKLEFCLKCSMVVI